MEDIRYNFNDTKLDLLLAFPYSEEMNDLRDKLRKNQFLRNDKYEKYSDQLNYYTGFKNQIDSHGFFIIRSKNKEYRLHTPEMCLILLYADKAFNMESKKIEKFDRESYLISYYDSYKKGQKYFVHYHKVSPNILFGQKSNSYLKNLEIKYEQEWSSARNSFPLLITHSAIKKYGYNSGVISMLEGLIKEYPILFKEDKKEKNLISKIFNAIEAKPNFMGLGIDIKKLIK